MSSSIDNGSDSLEVLIVGLARTGDRQAFGELVLRHQSWIRNLMRRLCGQDSLADDLAQLCFLQAWKDIRKLKDPARFNGWLKQVAVNTWRQQARRNDALNQTSALKDSAQSAGSSNGIAMDLDRALATLEGNEKLCVVLAYAQGMTHGEITQATGLPLGTVKSHVRRGAARLKELLDAYRPSTKELYS